MQTERTENPPSPSDEALLQRIQQKDVLAYEQLYNRHAPTLYNLLMRIVRDQQIAEEVLQESLWLVWQRAEQYGGAGSVAAWLHRIARNRALDQLRHQQSRPQRRPEEISALVAAPALQRPSAAHEAETAWRQQQLYLALSSLPVEQQQCLELAYFDGMSQREIAEQTNTPLGTIKTRVRIGMEKVERLLRAAGLTERDSS